MSIYVYILDFCYCYTIVWCLNFSQGNVRLSHVHTVIVDEVDTMLTQGFGNDIKELFTALAGQQGSDGDLGLISSSVPLDGQ